ncbi:MAG: pirin family protein, partial [Acidobacteria bacterium]|nr:pirin family protein [Acidobacteriota bacterium]MDW7985374.1 pirin family protein [Acidobacteriota bacterium]
AHLFDPFLLLDDFGSRRPPDYIAGFPWHPHRGFETVTYLLKGEVHHEDSTGTRGVIRAGDVQWMTAGSGIFHSEMPKPARLDDRTEDPELRGFQLWVNLPSDLKMTVPTYQNLTAEAIPAVALPNGERIRVIAGRFDAVEGPVQNSAVDVRYLDVSLPSDREFLYEVPHGYTVFAYVVEGEAQFDPLRWDDRVGARHWVLYERTGGAVRVRTWDTPVRFLLIAGQPIDEPIAWYGPIVMNTPDELAQAFEDLRRGTFVRDAARSVDLSG